jgi:hypothetical protein
MGNLPPDGLQRNMQKCRCSKIPRGARLDEKHSTLRITELNPIGARTRVIKILNPIGARIRVIKILNPIGARTRVIKLLNPKLELESSKT